MKCVFKKDGWSMEGLTHAYSIRFSPMPGFSQREDFIENVPTSASRDGYAYVSLVTKEKLTPNVKIATRCAFEGAAAPLVVLPRDLLEKNGRLYYGDYLEVVLYENGINVWDLRMDQDGTVKIKKLLGLEEKVQTGVIHEFSVEVREDQFIIALDGHRLMLRCENIFESFHLGITGCEGPCKFYGMEIEQV